MIPRKKYAELTPEDRAGVTYWDACDSETFTHESLEEAIAEAAGVFGDETIEVTAYVRGTVRLDSAGWILDHALETLDDIYGGSEENRATPAMAEAAGVFAAVLAAEYKVWRCNRVFVVEVDLKEWRLDNE